MGKKGGGNDEAKKARQAEEKRQADIRAGTQRINDIFDGSWSGSGALGADAAFDPNVTYYNADGSVWAPPAVSAGGGGNSGLQLASGVLDRQRSGNAPQTSSNTVGQPSGEGTWMLKRRPDGDSERVWVPAKTSGSANQMSAQEKAFREALAGGQLYSGRQKSSGFDDNFFSGRRQAYIDYASPQLEQQYGDAQKQLTFALTRSGNLDSSMRADKSAELQKMYDLNKQKIADEALSYETQARNAVEDARSGLISTLNATGDAQGAANAALARSQALSQAPAYNPLSQLFTDFTAGLGTQAAMERAEAASQGGYKSKYNTGLFGNAGRVQVG
ncbi:MAG: hypothetical protein ACTHLK_22610 [Brucella intermedia]